MSYFRSQRKNFQFSPLSVLAEHLSYLAFTVLRYFPSIPILLSVLIIKGCCNLSIALLHLLHTNMIIHHIIFMLYFVNAVYHTDGVVYDEPSLHPWNTTHLIVMCYHFNGLYSICCIFVRDFCIYFHRRY